VPDDKNKDKPSAHGKGKTSERDALDKLSLSSMPLSSSTLRNARLIKNMRMETSLEILNDPISGSLQIDPKDIADVVTSNKQDQAIIRALAALNSYDVYSLRKSLAKLGLEVEKDALTLSDDMKDMLAQNYMAAFTRPLLESVFGIGHDDADQRGLDKILNDSDVARVRENLKAISKKTGIAVEEIPEFLSAYSDVFLSVAYYRHNLERIRADVDRYIDWIQDLQKQRDVIASAGALNSCRRSEEYVRQLAESVSDRMSMFSKTFERFWSNINRASFDDLRRQVEETHDSLGAVLCGLMVKIRNWATEFPDNTVGSPAKRLAFVRGEMEPGLEKLKTLENEARKNTNMPPLL
jgi:hypothetical protein